MAIITADAKAPASTFRHPTKFSILDMRTPPPAGPYPKPQVASILIVYGKLMSTGIKFTQI
jgi:hypothetical protein